MRWWTACWPWLRLEGVAGIAAGLFAFLWPDITMLVLLYLIAAWMVVTGLLEVTAPSSCAGNCAASGCLPSPGSARWPSASS
jgi:uncharacterized membrane protein HdeD (DUF308 family)